MMNKIITESQKSKTPPKPVFKKNNKSSDKNITKELRILDEEKKEKKNFRPNSRIFKSQSPRNEVRKETENSTVGEESKGHFCEFSSYLAFICSEEKFFRINMNFDSLRNMSTREAWK